MTAVICGAPAQVRVSATESHMVSRCEHGTLGDIVSNNYQAAAVLERHGLDFCCGGRSSLAEARRQRNVDLATVLAELESLEAAEAGAPIGRPGGNERVVSCFAGYSGFRPA